MIYVWVGLFVCLWRRVYFCTLLASTALKDGWWEVGQYCVIGSIPSPKLEGVSASNACLLGFQHFHFMENGVEEESLGISLNISGFLIFWLLVRTVSMNFITEANFQLKCHLQHGSDPPAVAGLHLQVVALLPLSHLCLLKAVLFLLFTFSFPSILL